MHEEIEYWLNKLILIADKQKKWAGSIDFHIGKAYFELGNHEESLAALKEAKGFRYFEDEDPSIWTSLETLRSTWNDKLRNLRRTRIAINQSHGNYRKIQRATRRHL